MSYSPQLTDPTNDRRDTDAWSWARRDAWSWARRDAWSWAN